MSMKVVLPMAGGDEAFRKAGFLFAKPLIEIAGRALVEHAFAPLSAIPGAEFVFVIRKRIKLSPEKAIFIFVNDVLPPTAMLMSQVYDEYKDEDGFLYISYSGENTFG